MDFRKHLKHPWARQNTHVPWNPLGENVTGKCGDRTWERKTKVLQLARSLEIPTAFEHIYTHFALGKLYAAGSSMQKTTCRWPSPRIPPAAAGAESHLEALGPLGVCLLRSRRHGYEQAAACWRFPAGLSAPSLTCWKLRGI